MFQCSKPLIQSLSFILVTTLSACSINTGQTHACASVEKIGRFNPATDLFLANFDIKTDVDDLHSAAAIATILASPGFECVNYRAVSGTYGTQGGSYVDPGDIFANGFNENWIDAHSDREAAIRRLAKDVEDTLRSNGHVWIMEGGQSDVSAATVQAVLKSNPSIPLRNIHLVQHSSWNEKVTSEAALNFVKTELDYVKLSDGNVVGNGSPGFTTTDGSVWPVLLADPNVGDMWAEVRSQGIAHNGTGSDDVTIAAGGYHNKAIGAGGVDFSDTVEAMWIFGYEHLSGEKDFVETFVKTTE